MTTTETHDRWAGEGWYTIEYSDGGQDFAGGAVWVESESDYDDLMKDAHSGDTEYHLAYSDYHGDLYIPEDWLMPDSDYKPTISAGAIDGALNIIISDFIAAVEHDPDMYNSYGDRKELMHNCAKAQGLEDRYTIDGLEVKRGGYIIEAVEPDENGYTQQLTCSLLGKDGYHLDGESALEPDSWDGAEPDEYERLERLVCERHDIDPEHIEWGLHD